MNWIKWLAIRFPSRVKVSHFTAAAVTDLGSIHCPEILARFLFLEVKLSAVCSRDLLNKCKQGPGKVSLF
jgi:hypothetical protein